MHNSMYNKLRYLILGLFLIITSGALGQSPTSPLFGKDIVIHDMPDRDQRNVAVCSAFNGWLYAAFSYDSSLYTHLMVVRSTDHGITWNPFYIFSYAAVKYMVVSSLDIVTVGNNAGNLRLIIGFSHLDTTNVASSAALISVNGIT